MASFIEIIEANPTAEASITTSVINSLLTKGVLNYSTISANIINIIKYKFGNVDTRYKINEITGYSSILSRQIVNTIFPDFMMSTNFTMGKMETISKTGTESDAGSFDNDPTTNDEYRSYPFDTTATDVQSKTRSIVNGAESGTNSNTKTYNTTDSKQMQEQSYEIEKQYSNIVYEYTENFVREVIQLLRTNQTYCDPLTDDATLLELEF